MSDDHHSIVRRTSLPRSVSRPVVTPIYPSVVYASDSPDQLDAQYDGQVQGYTYAREGHPNATVLAEKIDWLEGATGGIITGSGMGAVSAVLLGLLNKGDHVLAGDQLYGRSMRLLMQDLPRMGLAADLADPTNAKAFEAAIRPNTKIILVEVVSNPTLRIADMDAIAAMAQARGVLLVVDNTFTTPASYKPLEHGADIALHSVTKLLAGHADVTLGYVAAKDAAVRKAIYDAVVTFGFTPSPQECWLAERGLHTFNLRFERAQATARVLADHLAGLDGVAQVFYPGRSDHPDHYRARAVLGDNPGNMLSFALKGGRVAANAFTRAAPHIPFAPTLGDVATTLSHPASSSHRALSEEARQALGISQGFFRVSVGIEGADQLVREFSAAVAAAKDA